MTNNIEKLNELLVARIQKLEQIQKNSKEVEILQTERKILNSELEDLSTQIATHMEEMGFSGLSDDLASATIEDGLSSAIVEEDGRDKRPKKIITPADVKVGDVLKFGISTDHTYGALGEFTGRVVRINPKQQSMPFDVHVISPSQYKDLKRRPNIKNRSWELTDIA